MASPEVNIKINVEGLDQLREAFNLIGSMSGESANKVTAASNQMDVSYKRLALTTAGLMTNALQLSDIWTRMASGQMDLARGAIMLGLNFLQLATQIWTIVGAEHARAIAHAVAHALSGPPGWVILGVAAGIAAGAIAYAAATIPSKQFGGPIYETRPYLLHAGEYVLPRGASAVTINIYGAGSPRQTSDAIIDALRRNRVI